jgi:hypothetical protein
MAGRGSDEGVTIQPRLVDFLFHFLQLEFCGSDFSVSQISTGNEGEMPQPIRQLIAGSSGTLCSCTICDQDEYERNRPFHIAGNRTTELTIIEKGAGPLFFVAQAMKKAAPAFLLLESWAPRTLRSMFINHIQAQTPSLDRVVAVQFDERPTSSGSRFI